ncbi:MAG: heat-inducible transcriptional repressor HrcA [Rhodospirillales bacterium]
MIVELNRRSREILRHIVDAYVETGEPVGSRTVSRRLGMSLSPATIRNVMSDLEELGLLVAPHTSAGRLPTEAGLRLFVQGLVEVGGVAVDERDAIDARCAARGLTMQEALEQASSLLAGLSSCAGLVVAPKLDRPMRHIEFVHLGTGRALVVLVTEDGLVENRVVEVPPGILPAHLTAASNYLNARLTGRTLDEARSDVLREIEEQRTALDALSTRVVEAGLAVPAMGEGASGLLIVRGQRNLLEDVTAISDLERIRGLFEALEAKDAMLRLLEATKKADGVQIYIGAENTLFRHAGCSMIVAPYQNAKEQIVGAIGVIGPTRMNYARIIPMVDYTAKVVGRLLG